MTIYNPSHEARPAKDAIIIDLTFKSGTINDQDKSKKSIAFYQTDHPTEKGVTDPLPVVGVYGISMRDPQGTLASKIQDSSNVVTFSEYVSELEAAGAEKDHPEELQGLVDAMEGAVKSIEKQAGIQGKDDDNRLVYREFIPKYTSLAFAGSDGKIDDMTLRYHSLRVAEEEMQ